MYIPFHIHCPSKPELFIISPVVFINRSYFVPMHCTQTNFSCSIPHTGLCEVLIANFNHPKWLAENQAHLLFNPVLPLLAGASHHIMHCLSHLLLFGVGLISLPLCSRDR